MTVGGCVYVLSSRNREDTHMRTTPYQASPTQEADARADEHKANDNHPIKITVRTMAGHSRKETVKPDDRVADLTDDAVKYFANRGDITEGKYASLDRAFGSARLWASCRTGDSVSVRNEEHAAVDVRPFEVAVLRSP